MAFVSSRPRNHKRCRQLSSAELEQVRGGAVANDINEDSATEVMNNPLYMESEASGSNPFSSDGYEAL